MSENRAVPEGWVERRLGEIITLIGGGTPKTTIENYWNGKIPWLSVADFNNESRWVSKTEKTITEKGLIESSTKLLKSGDLIISARGTVGVLAQLNKDMAFNQSCYGIQSKKNISDINFLYYLIKFEVKQISKNVHGAVFDTITRDTFDSIKITLPPLPEQQAIARMLSSFDDKIELLREQNETLEKTAQTIFQEWFGKYSPERPEELPEGWRVGSLTEIAHFLNGIALQKYPPENETDYLPVIKIRELKAGITGQTDKASKNIDSKYIVDTGDILFSWSGSLEVVIWQFGEGALNQHLFKVSSENYPKWFYFYWTLFHLPEFRGIASNKATTMGHIQRHHIEQAMIIIPNKQKFDDMNRVFEPILEKIMLVNSQIQSLSKSRNLLLPKLMSGGLRLEV